MKDMNVYEPSHKISEIRVLYHDNEEDQIREFRENIKIERFKSFRSTLDSNDALMLATSGEYDVFICDYRLPGRKDGIMILEESMRGNKNLKTILYTGFTLQKDHVQKCVRLGIKRAKKLESETLSPLISLVANEVSNMKEEFKETVRVTSKEVKEDLLPEDETVTIGVEGYLDASRQDKTPPKEVLKESILIFAKDLIDDYRRIPNPNDVKIHFGPDDIRSAVEVLEELENLTPTGIEIIRHWMYGRKVI